MGDMADARVRRDMAARQSEERSIAKRQAKVEAIIEYVAGTMELPFMARSRDVCPEAFAEDRTFNEGERRALKAADRQAALDNENWARGLLTAIERAMS